MAIQRKHVACAISLFIFATVDISLTTVLFARGKQFRLNFLRDVYEYTFSSSLFDIWVMALLRAVVLLGVWLGFVCNPYASVIRVKQFKALATVLVVIIWSYNIVKMLAYTDRQTDVRDPWYWSLFSWTGVACLGLYILWNSIGNLKLAEPRAELTLNVTEEERTPLLNDENTKKKKVPTATLR